MATLLELISNLDTNNYVRGRQFEHICKWYLENDPKYRMELKKVWLWNEWPDKWGADAGIDLVAKTYDDKLWAIQAKAYDDKYSIKKADVDTFLSESSREIFSFRLLIATTNLVGQTAERTLQDQEKPVGQILFSDLEKSAVIWPSSPDKLEVKFQEQKKPRPHQEKAISDVCKGFSEHNRGQLIMACGTGKTLVALWAAERLQSQRTLILLPSLSLLAQTLREWTANASQNFHYLPVCSDDTVRDADHFISRTSEIGLPVTTKPDEVAEFLRKQGHIVVFSTYQSSPVIAKAFSENNVPAFDLAIADEAHRCAGIGTGPFATILDSNAIKTKNRLFMTATPRYFTDRVQEEAEEVDYEIASMDDESKFGPAFHQLTFSEAIKQDLLSDYQVVIVGVDDETYLTYAKQGTYVTIDGEYVTDAHTLASHIAIAKAMKKYDLYRIISFHSRVKKAKGFSENLPKVLNWIPEESRPRGMFWADYICGEMPSGKRDTILNRFRHLNEGERALVANARCLGEGVDVPSLDGIAFIDPRHSSLDIVQAVGRAIRKTPDKKIGTVVLPVFIDAEQDPEKVMESSCFKPVWEVLKALRAHDEVLADQLDRLRRQLGRQGSTEITCPDKIFIDLPVNLEKSFVNSIHLKVIKKATTSWEFYYGLLEKYVSQKGHAKVFHNYITEDGYKLGYWANSQRAAYRSGKLPLEYQKKLELLPEWTWKPTEAAWQGGFQYLCEYIKREGHPVVPKSYFTEDNYNLGSWVAYQHLIYQKGKLLPERQKLLEQLPGWVWKPKAESHLKSTSWNVWYERLIKYVDLYGSLKLSHYNYHTTKDGYHLGIGRWVATQRKSFGKGSLSEDHQKLLEQIPGWEWSIQKAKIRQLDSSKWDNGFKHLQKYAQLTGHTRVPSQYVTSDGYNLGTWVAAQRTAYRKGNLLAERKKLLKQLPEGVWGNRIAKTGRSDSSQWSNKKANISWSEGLKHLLKYLKLEGHVLVPLKCVTKNGFKLGWWVSQQRSLYKLGKLTIKQQKTLELLPGWVWEIHEQAWTKGFEYLCEYAKREGHANVPRRYVDKDGYKLGLWVMFHRQMYKQGRLSKKRKIALEQLPGWVWSQRKSREQGWEKGLEHLRKYAESNGHAFVPTRYVMEEGYRLGVWVAMQRRAYKQGNLPAEKQKALEELPGWEWGKSRKQEWINGFEHLQKYAESEGHTAVPVNFVAEDGYELGNWVRNQKQFYIREKMSAERQKTLEQLRGWAWDAQEEPWTKGFECLQKYAESEGHTSVPTKYVTEDGYYLGSWVQNQRQFYKRGKLSAERRKALEQLPGWVWAKEKIGTPWSTALKYLQEYVNREGHASVPAVYITDDGYKLGTWVRDQRYEYNIGQLSKEKQMKLEQLPGCNWSARRIGMKTWTEAFELLRQYAEAEGHTSVPTKYVTEDGYCLGSWVQNQRQFYKRGKLSAERQKALEQLPGWVWSQRKSGEQGWSEAFEHLRKYVKSNGHASVPSKYVTEDGYDLGIWVSNQRQLYKRGKLSAEKQKILEQLPGWVWNIRKTTNKNDG